MGTLRFLLAVSVATGHAGCVRGYCLVPGPAAVQAFYIVSGFLMALVLNEKYGPDDTWLFYSNRALRIYVPYLAVFAAAFVAIAPLTLLLGHGPGYAAALIDAAPKLDLAAWIFLAFTSLAIVGQDVALWLGFDGHLYVTGSYQTSPVWVQSLQLVPQAWSLSLELTFYALAPFLLRGRFALLIGIIAASLALRAVASRFGLDGDPWSYRFFPFELAHFLAGALAYRIYAATRDAAVWSRPVCFGVMAAVIGSVLAFDLGWRQAGSEPRLFLVAVAASTPFLFLATRRSRLDGMLGELSYPIYLIHLPLQSVLLTLVAGGLPLGVWSVPATVATSILFVTLVDRPLERWRQARTRRPARSAAGASFGTALPAPSG
jgi:peptidoglycan/LPS O-acetylase OafA/YrhL